MIKQISYNDFSSKLEKFDTYQELMNLQIGETSRKLGTWTILNIGNKSLVDTATVLSHQYHSTVAHLCHSTVRHQCHCTDAAYMTWRVLEVLRPRQRPLRYKCHYFHRGPTVSQRKCMVKTPGAVKAAKYCKGCQTQ